MTKRDDIYFEIFDGGDIVRIEVKSNVKDPTLGWDANWIKTKVTVKGGKFAGQFDADFLAVDFEMLRKDLNRLYNDLKGYAHFSGLERQLNLKIIGDGFGHFGVDVIAYDDLNVGAKLTFTMSFDQTIIKDLVSQLDNILNACKK